MYLHKLHKKFSSSESCSKVSLVFFKATKVETQLAAGLINTSHNAKAYRGV